jgi:SAM-dependent methyltransferase
MTSTPPRASAAIQLARQGLSALDARNYSAAKSLFAEAARLEPHSAVRRMHLARALDGLGDLGGAAVQLTEALRLDAKNADAARDLSSILARHILKGDEALDPEGLRAALGQDAVSRDSVADAATRYLSARDPLRGLLEFGRTKGWESAARSLCAEKTDPILADKLLLELLCGGVVASAEIERLLVALRRAISQEVPPARLLTDSDLIQFAVALVRQCWANEYLWQAEAEELKFAAAEIDLRALLAGDAGQGAALLVASLYAPTYRKLAADESIALEALGNIQPALLGSALAGRVAEWRDETARARSMLRRGDFANETSRNIAGQYEAAPYPRWTRLGLSLRGEEFKNSIAQHFEPGRLAFTARPFDILVAGCGTGKTAIQLALGFGPNANVVAIDLSAASLGYASRLAKVHGAKNITFLQADIEDIGTYPDFRERFRIIDCAGVLHHMADTFSGWRSILRCLAPGGLMRIGLYSATGRATITALRTDPAYPGTECSDEQLRAFRRVLLEREKGEPGSELKASVDFYSMSGFRDLTLNVSERCHTLPEIEAFLADAGLRFRGFFPPYLFQLLRQRNPKEPWPGSLERWARLERAMPILFTQMYVFWCDRR